MSRRPSTLARIATLALLAMVIACGTPPPATSETAQALSTITNGSFETGDYTGWTLIEAPAGQPADGTLGIALDGETLTSSSPLFDFANGITSTSSSPGLPFTFAATAGQQVAYALQAAIHDQRMYQDIDVPLCGAQLRWDMAYRNHAGVFSIDDQFIALNVRALDDSLIERPYFLFAGPLSATTMTPKVIDLSLYAGQTVRLDFQVRSQLSYFDVVWDDIRITCTGAPAIAFTPTTLDFGNIRVGTTSPGLTADFDNVTMTAVTLLSVTGSHPAFSFTAPALPFTLAGNTGSALAVAFSPDRVGQFSETIAIVHDDPTSPAVLTVKGNGVEAVASFNVTSIDFGPQPTGTTSTEKLAELKNSGLATMTVTAVTATAPFTITSPTTGFVLAPGATQTIAVTYTPTAIGAVNGIVEVTSDATNSPTAIPLTGAGAGAEVTVQPPALTFPPQKVGTTSPSQFLSLTNTGTTTLDVSSVSVTGPFTLVSPLTGFALSANETTTIEVTFTPGVAGLQSDLLQIASSAPGSPTEIELSGLGTLGALVVSPGTLAFGDIRTGGRSPEQPLVVTNQGDASLTITQITAPAGYVIGGRALPLGLLPGAQETLTVTVAPTVAGPTAGAIEFTTTTGPTTVQVTATAVPRALVADVPVIDVGPIRLGEASAAQLVTLTNVTAGPVRIARATPRDGAVVLDPRPSTTEIPPGGAVTLGLRFVPMTTGAVTTSVDIVLDGVPTPDVTVEVTGTGTSTGDASGCSAGAGAAPWWLGVLGLGLRRRRRRA